LKSILKKVEEERLSVKKFARQKLSATFVLFGCYASHSSPRDILDDNCLLDEFAQPGHIT
jgi:hypothetical protein